eukprot:GHVL01019437.1.p1 GENE.GHVL01019437.1~~GHVL01019437.1.p1  ORF type:complete len:270 (+),score=46.84 GHVL01019437.1:69-878(+)
MNPENVQLVQYLQQLRKKLESQNNSAMSSSIGKVIRSMTLYPLPIRTGADAAGLEGVGRYCSTLIATFLENNNKSGLSIQISHRQEVAHKKKVLQKMIRLVELNPHLYSPDLLPESPKSSKIETAKNVGAIGVGAEKKKLPKLSTNSESSSSGKKMYKPPKGSAGWFILISLHIWMNESIDGHMDIADMTKGCEKLSHALNLTIKDSALKNGVKNLFEREILKITNDNDDGQQKRGRKSNKNVFFLQKYLSNNSVFTVHFDPHGYNCCF